MKLMLQVAYDYLKENKQGSLQQIFEIVKNELKIHWKESFPSLMMDKIEEKKLGELYTYLTTDGRFVMLDKNNWTIVTALTSQELLRARSKVVLDSLIDEDLELISETDLEPSPNIEVMENEELINNEEINITEEANLVH